MRVKDSIGLSLIILWVLFGAATPASADVSVGDVIDKTNWEKVQGLMPEPFVDWIKKGDYVLHIEELNFNPAEFHPPFVLDSLETNKGKYDLNEDNELVEVEAGKVVKNIEGFPFPEIDMNHPNAGVKMAFNNRYSFLFVGQFRAPFHILWVGRSGSEREIKCIGLNASLDGYPAARELPNREGIQKYMILGVKAPYDVAGTAILLWRYVAPKEPDKTFGYIPAIRRVRRMSPANRSDSFVGSDLCVDDANGYDGKIQAFDWKFLRKQEGILPFLSKDPQQLVQNEEGAWETTKGMKAVVHGYDQDGWQGTPWAATNYVWVKRPVYVVEMNPKDRYYNYGTQYMWFDAETFAAIYKVIHDRSGKYWKFSWIANSGFESADKEMQLMFLSGQYSIDDRTDHASIAEDASPRNQWAFFSNLDMNDFSLSGFQKFCK